MKPEICRKKCIAWSCVDALEYGKIRFDKKVTGGQKQDSNRREWTEKGVNSGGLISGTRNASDWDSNGQKSGG